MRADVDFTTGSGVGTVTIGVTGKGE